MTNYILNPQMPLQPCIFFVLQFCQEGVLVILVKALSVHKDEAIRVRVRVRVRVRARTRTTVRARSIVRLTLGQ